MGDKHLHVGCHPWEEESDAPTQELAQALKGAIAAIHIAATATGYPIAIISRVDLQAITDIYNKHRGDRPAMESYRV